ISLRSKNFILSLLATDLSMTGIARQATTSVSYVLNILVNSIDPYNLSKYDNLPKHICIDEVRVINRICNFICCDAVKGTIIGVLPSLDGKSIMKFFQKFSFQTRQSVETVTMDLNINYPNIMRRLFPNAKLITDRFHLVKMMYSAFNGKKN
ncbi:transposase, partial [Ligilactobacillus salivarius]